MGIVHTRIDDRLIHGQVAAFWTNSLNIHRIMIPNDEIATDEVRKSIIRLAAPPGVRTSLVSIERAANNIKAGKYDQQRLFIIFEDPRDAVDLINRGVKIDKINVGNMGHKEGARQVRNNIHVTAEQVKALKELDRMGIRLTARMVPSDPEIDFMRYLKSVFE